MAARSFGCGGRDHGRPAFPRLGSARLPRISAGNRRRSGRPRCVGSDLRGTLPTRFTVPTATAMSTRTLGRTPSFPSSGSPERSPITSYITVTIACHLRRVSKCSSELKPDDVAAARFEPHPLRRRHHMLCKGLAQSHVSGCLHLNTVRKSAVQGSIAASTVRRCGPVFASTTSGLFVSTGRAQPPPNALARAMWSVVMATRLWINVSSAE